MDKTLLFLFIIKHFGTIKFEAKFLSPSFTLLRALPPTQPECMNEYSVTELTRENERAFKTFLKVVLAT